MSRHRGNGGASPGLLLLLYQLFIQTGIESIPPVTLIVIALQTAIFTDLLDPQWGGFHESSLEARSVLRHRELHRFFTAAFEHASDLHLYYNMASFLYKGMRLEKRYGSGNFGLVLTFLTFLSGFFYVVLAIVFSEVLDDSSYMTQRAVGFSGVIFALKVLVNQENLDDLGNVNKLAVWSELLLIQLAVPNASFMGHLAGILAGLLYCYGYQLFKLPIDFIRGHPRSLLLISLLLLLHNEFIPKPWMSRSFFKPGSHTFCLNAKAIWERNEWMRLISAPLEHRGNVHLAISLISLLFKGVVLEQSLSAGQHLLTIVYSLLVPGVVYTAMSALLHQSDVVCPMGLTMSLFCLKPSVMAKLSSLYTSNSLSNLFLLPLFVFEVIEGLMLMETDTRLSLICSLIAGFILLQLTTKPRFPGQGIELNDWRRTSRNFEPSAPPLWDEDIDPQHMRQRRIHYYQ